MRRTLCEGVVVVCFATPYYTHCQECVQITKQSFCEGVVVVCFATLSLQNVTQTIGFVWGLLLLLGSCLLFAILGVTSSSWDCPLRLTCPRLPAPVSDDTCAARYVKRACPPVQCKRPSSPALWKHGCLPLRFTVLSGCPRLETCLAAEEREQHVIAVKPRRN